MKVIKKIVLISTILTSTLLFSDSVIISDERPTFQKRHTFNKEIKEQKSSRKYSNKKFRRDHHRYDKRYRSFDYDRDGYYNDEGFYYGYYDDSGYFYNNIFFEYNARYSYHDRVYRRGYFRPNYEQLRVYRYHTHNNWNRVHCYREPDVVVHGYYYDSPTYYRHSYNNAHQTRYYDERDHGRVSHGRFSDHEDRRAYRQAENRRDDFREDNRYHQRRDNYRHRNNRREVHRDNRRHRRDHGHISRGRFSDKSSNKNHKNSHKSNGYLRISN